MSEINLNQFNAYFHELYGRDQDAYSWQRRLAERAVKGDWPGAIDLPTGCGKTACIDIAVFALACQADLSNDERTAPRRIFFCVNRRVIVDEAYQRAKRLARSIWEAEQGSHTGNLVLKQVASVLRKIAMTKSGSTIPPIDVLELRGGIYRDNRWARSITQPTIICTTIDQLGSRLLFRGYGVSRGAAPIHAALITYDSLILLDEAHISEPFRQTLDYVQRYLDPQKWAEESIGVKPVTVVPMTATPNEAMVKRGLIQLDDDDRQSRSLSDRLSVNKPAQLKLINNIADDTVKTACGLAENQHAAVGIMVNRVSTARSIYEKLKNKNPDSIVELVIGSMRPIDRDVQADRLGGIIGKTRPQQSTQTSYVVATQCLEVGADYDFDVLITECASLDALRQRFGRLNRGGRDIKARAMILAEKSAIKPDGKLDDDKPLDPIYGNAMTRTWNWLNAHAADGQIDFGIDAFASLLNQVGETGKPPHSLYAPSASLNAPVMLPAYIDFWCQTAPRPVPDPDVSLFLHGPVRSEPDIQVCWRSDLFEDDSITIQDWCEVVALLPPTSAECMSVPISRLRRWLDDQVDDAGVDGDILGMSGDSEESKNNRDKQKQSLRCSGVIWRGAGYSILIDNVEDIRPGDTLVMPVSTVSSRLLGHLPDHATQGSEQNMESIHDCAEEACLRARNRIVLRLHPKLKSHHDWPKIPEINALYEAAAEQNELISIKEWKNLLSTAAAVMVDGDVKKAMDQLVKHGFRLEYYPRNSGVVITSRRRTGTDTNWYLPATDDGDDEISCIYRDKPVTISDHTHHVDVAACCNLALLSVGMDDVYKAASLFHDWGKCDERFQAMLRRTDRTDAWLIQGVKSDLLAKSDGVPIGKSERKKACIRAGLPEGFRHEMFSVQLADLSSRLPGDPSKRDLVLHLIASHHGYARPFAPVTVDDELPDIEIDGLLLSHEERNQLIPSHRLDSGVAQRFWSLTRRYGWWGLAYLECILRLADQQASSDEDAGINESVNAGKGMEIVI